MLTTVSDNCSATTAITINQNPSAGFTFSGHGTTQTITITAEDERGNSSVCTTSIYLRDTIPPLLSCPTLELISVDMTCQIMLADYTTVVSADDNCVPDATIILTQDPPVGTILMGDGTTTIVTITGNDTNGNSSQCQFTVELTNAIDPSITCPSNQNIEVDNSCEAVIPDYTSQAIVISNCFPATDFTVTQNPVGGTILSTLGMTQTITLTADNGAGKSNVCSFDITVIDTLPPIVTCPMDLTVMTNADCEVILLDYTSDITVSDNCSLPMDITINQNPTPATILMGTATHTIVMTATDETGHSSQCTFEITTVDGVPPTITCPPNDSLILNATCEITLADYTTNATVMDLCASPIDITITQSPLPSTILMGTGEQEIILTAYDGVDSSTCLFSLILQDTLPPVLTCPLNQDVTVNQSCLAVVPDYTAMGSMADPCNPAILSTITQTPASGTLLSAANTLETITLTATDNSGNQEMCSFVIQLIDDIPPTLTCPDNQMIFVNGCDYVVPDFAVDAIYSDNCSPNSSITIIQNPVPTTILADMGIQEISLMAIDENGNSVECTFQIELEFMFPAVPTVFGN